MIVDTNVLLRAITGEPEAGRRAVHGRISSARASGEHFLVMAPTVLEVVYVLESTRAGYGWDRESICRAVDAILDEPAFDVEHLTALRRAAATYLEQSMDFHDCFLSATAERLRTRVLSFDRDLRRLGTGERP